MSSTAASAGTTISADALLWLRPGMWLQNFTTNEPDDSMLEVAIRALELVIPGRKGQGCVVSSPQRGENRGA